MSNRTHEYKAHRRDYSNHSNHVTSRTMRCVHSSALSNRVVEYSGVKGTTQASDSHRTLATQFTLSGTKHYSTHDVEYSADIHEGAHKRRTYSTVRWQR